MAETFTRVEYTSKIPSLRTSIRQGRLKCNRPAKHDYTKCEMALEDYQSTLRIFQSQHLKKGLGTLRDYSLRT